MRVIQECFLSGFGAIWCQSRCSLVTLNNCPVTFSGVTIGGGVAFPSSCTFWHYSLPWPLQGKIPQLQGFINWNPVIYSPEGIFVKYLFSRFLRISLPISGTCFSYSELILIICPSAKLFVPSKSANDKLLVKILDGGWF